MGPASSSHVAERRYGSFAVANGRNGFSRTCGFRE